jgi:hypothetical protein
MDFPSLRKNLVYTFHITGMSASSSQTVLNSRVLPVAAAVKFLGFLFDSQLSWEPHLLWLSDKCRWLLNIWKVVCGLPWGRDQTVMPRLYHALIYSKFDYGSILYGSTIKSKMCIVDLTHNTGIYCTTGAFTPVIYLVYAWNVENLHFLCEGTSSSTQPPPPPPSPFLECGVSTHRPEQVHTECQSFSICGHFLPPWCLNIHLSHQFPIDSCGVHLGMSYAQSDLWLITHIRGERVSTSYHHLFMELLSDHPDYLTVYTDGSFVQGLPDCGLLYWNHVFYYYVHSFDSIYIAELYTIYRAHLYIRQQHLHCHLHHTDAFLWRVSIDTYWTIWLLWRLYIKCWISISPRNWFFCWVSSHTVLTSNEAADITVLHGGSLWAWALGSTLHACHPVVCLGKMNGLIHRIKKLNSFRKKSCLYAFRLVTPTSYKDRGHLVRGDPAPVYMLCGALLTILHVLQECPHYNKECQACHLHGVLHNIRGVDHIFLTVWHWVDKFV